MDAPLPVFRKIHSLIRGKHMAQPVAAATGFCLQSSIRPRSTPSTNGSRSSPRIRLELREKAYTCATRSTAAKISSKPPRSIPANWSRICSTPGAAQLGDRPHERRRHRTVRLILPDPRTPEASFPIQHVCGTRFPRSPPTARPRKISRFAIEEDPEGRGTAPRAGFKIGEGNLAMAAKAMKCSLTLC